MPEIKNTFTQGKMNQDLDERIVPNGQYIDAMNIKVTSSDDASVGVVQNILGNYRVESIIPPGSGYICIATIADEKTNKLYWFVTKENPTIHAILEYDLKTEDTKFVLVDKKNDTLKFTKNIITGVNIIDNLLFWTDNYSEPKKINIDNCIQGTDQNATSLDNAVHTKLVVDGIEKDDISEKNITVIKKSPKQPPSITINKPTDENKPKLFEQVFPRFSFRYRYEDGEYSSFGPFTQVVFNPVYVSGESGYNRENAYSTKDSHNLAMINHIESIEISNFISSSTPEDVTQVEILYKEDGSSVVFSIKTIDHEDIDWTNNECTLKSESIFAAIPSNQFLRPWDNVPKKALAQEITGNRIVYANYTQGYDLLAWNGIKVGNKINASFGLRENNLTFDEGGLPSLKTQRNYQVGFVWGDKYGRETPVFTSESGGVNIPWYDGTIDKLLASQSLFLKTNLATFIPTWADYYKIYVKETSGDYYNMLMEKAYPQSNLNVFDFEEDRVWLAFPSADRNKITEDDYLIIKKQLVGDHSQISLENKFKILDIQNEAPDAIKFEYTSLGKAAQTSDSSTTFLNDDLFKSAEFRIDQVVDMIHISKNDWLDVLGGASLSPDDNGDNLHVKDLYIYWLSDGTESERYKVVGINVVNSVYRLKLQKPIEIQDAQLADIGGVENDQTTVLKANLEFFIDRKDEKDADEFSGKFFVQIVYKPPTMPEDLGINSPRQITSQIQSNWLYDVVTADSVDANGIINVGVDNDPPANKTSEVNTGNPTGPTNTLALWDSLASTMSVSERGFFIDNMYMVAGQPSDTFSAKLSGKTWVGWKEGDADLIPKWRLLDNGDYGWTTNYGNNPELITSSYNPRAWALNNNISKDVTKAMNGLEGFLTTKNEHVGDTTQGPTVAGFRRWKGASFAVGKPLKGLGDNTYGILDNGQNPVNPTIYGDTNQAGRHFIHLSFLAPGEDLHDGIWTLLNTEAELKGVDSVGNYMQAIWGGGIFTGSGQVLEMEGNYDASENPLAGVPGPGVGQGYDLGPANIYKTKHDNQWNPAYGGTTEENAKIQEFINNIIDGAEFHFSSDTNKTRFRIIGDKKVKRIYNHTPWIAQYKWDGSTQNPTANSGLILCQNSVDEAASAWLADTSDATKFEFSNADSLQKRITEFGKASNRRVVYIFEVDTNPLDVAGVNTLLTDANGFDCNSPLDIVFTSSSPNVLLKDLIKGTAIWETEAKPGEELDLYYEASQAIPIYLTDETNELFAPVNSRVEILLDEARNGKFIVSGDVLLESWNNTEITLSGDGFNKKDTSNSDIVYVDAQIRFFRPDGSYTTTKIVSVDDSQPDYVKDITLDTVLDASMEQGLSYFNCYSFGNGIESNRIRDDFNAPSISKGVKASLVLDQEYKEENRKNGLIYSGIYNSTSGVNNLNQFIMAENITKDLNPTYGSIQKLFQRRISLVAFCEDKTISITSNKDALFNADGKVQLVATNSVLGDATPFVGDFGISKNPESFAKESYRAYFADKQRGAVLRLSMDGITPISDAGMDDYFRDNLKLSGEIIGSYDAHSKNYNVTLKGNKPGDNIVANNSINVGVSSINFLIPTNLVIDGNTNAYIPISSPTIDVANNIYQNDDIIVETTITNYDEIGIGDLIAPTSTTTTTVTNNRQLGLHSFNSGVIFNQGFKTTNNWGGFSDPNDPVGTWTNNSGTARDPFSEKVGNTHAERQYIPQVTYTNRFSSFTAIPFPGQSESQTGSAVSTSGDAWWYNGTNDPAPDYFFDTQWPATQTTEPNSGSLGLNTEGIILDFTDEGLLLPGNHAPVPVPTPGGGGGFVPSDNNTTVNTNVTGYIDQNGDQPFAYATDTTVFNGEEVKIKFGFKNPEDFDVYGGNSNNPRRIQLTLYDGFDMSRTAVAQSSILAAGSVGGMNMDTYSGGLSGGLVSTTDWENTGVSGWDANATHNYAISPSVVFNNIEDSNANGDFEQTHEVNFKFYDGSGVDKILVDNLQVEIKVLDDNNVKSHGIITYFQIRKQVNLNQPEEFTTSTTSDNNPVPSSVIPAFATVTHSLPNWSLSNPGGPLDITNFISAAITEYGTEFSDLIAQSETQSGSGASASWFFPASGDEDNGTTAYNTVANGTYTTDDKLNINNTYTIITQDSLTSLLLNDWYFVDLIYNSYTPGTNDTIIKSPGNNTAFEEIQTDIHGTLGQNVLRAIFKIDYNQQLGKKIEFAVGYDTIIEIEEVKLIKINDPMTGGGMTYWNFNTDPNSSQHSFDPPSIYGGFNGIEFNVDISDSKRYVYQNFTTPPTPTNSGYKLQFEISNYVSGSLDLYTIGVDANGNPEGITIKDVIDADGNYSIDFNFDDNSYDLINDGVVVGQTIPASTPNITSMTNLVIFQSDSNNGFIGAVSNINLVDLTNYFTGASFDSFNVSGFDQNFYNYIDFEDLGNNQGQIVFNNSPILGVTGDQIQIEQLINKTIRQEEMYRLVFDYNISSGSIGIYYFSSLGNKGFKRTSITGSGTFNELITINEDHAGSDLLNTLVFFVEQDNTSGAIDNIVLRQEFLEAETSTLSFSENVKGWVSKKSFIPEQGVSISNEYFTMYKGCLYEHNSDVEVRNTFYGEYEPSTITAVLNQSPSSIKSFNTLNYEGSQSNIIAGDAAVSVGGNNYNTLETYNLIEDKGWSVDYIKTDKQEGSLDEFVEKEGKWFNYIKGLSTNVKTSDLSFQGLGIVKTIN